MTNKKCRFFAPNVSQLFRMRDIYRAAEPAGEQKCKKVSFFVSQILKERISASFYRLLSFEIYVRHQMWNFWKVDKLLSFLVYLNQKWNIWALGAKNTPFWPSTWCANMVKKRQKKQNFEFFVPDLQSRPYKEAFMYRTLGHHIYSWNAIDRSNLHGF